MKALFCTLWTWSYESNFGFEFWNQFWLYGYHTVWVNGKGWKRNNCYQKDLCSCFCSIIGGMGLELSSITINYLAVLKTFCVHVLCNLYNLSSLTEMKLFQWRRLVFVLNCWLQPSPRAAPIISWSFASELKVNGDRSSPWNSLDFFWTEKLKMRFLAARKPKSHCKC